MAAVHDAIRRVQMIASDGSGPKPSLPPKEGSGGGGGGGDDGGGEDERGDSPKDQDEEPDNKRSRRSLQDKPQGQWSSGATPPNDGTRRTTRTMEKNRKQQVQVSMPPHQILNS
jgi:hypothetical protein